jgi:hypothetical protein
VRAYLRGLPLRAGARLNALIGRALPWLIRRALRRELHGVYASGAWAALPPTGALLAANHHTWWDLYLAWLVKRRLGRPLSGLILPETLRRFPFFRAIGALPTTELREALRRVGRGELLIIFPEGRLCPPGRVAELEPGLAFLARRAQVPVYPLAIRAVMRGAQRPEVFLRLGEAVAPDEVRGALDALLAELEAEISRTDPEAPLPGFERWSGGARSAHERTAWVGKLLRRETT